MQPTANTIPVPHRPSAVPLLLSYPGPHRSKFTVRRGQMPPKMPLCQSGTHAMLQVCTENCPNSPDTSQYAIFVAGDEFLSCGPLTHPHLLKKPGTLHHTATGKYQVAKGHTFCSRPATVIRTLCPSFHVFQTPAHPLKGKLLCQSKVCGICQHALMN